MTVGANARHGTLGSEELLPVASEARLMLGVFSHIGKCLITLPNCVPVF